MPPNFPVLHICRKCKANTAVAENEATPGQHLLDAVLLQNQDGIVVMPVDCLSACRNGCTAALTQPGKWSYVLGTLLPDHAADLLQLARLYADSTNGLVPKPKRPEALRSAILSRVPPLPLNPDTVA